MKTTRNRELLMAVANDATTMPRDFKHVRRLRAVLTAETQRKEMIAKSSKSGGKDNMNDPVAMARAQAQTAQAEKKRIEDDRKLREVRPLVGVGSKVRIKPMDKPTYGWGDLEPNKWGIVKQVRLLKSVLNADEMVWNYLIEMETTHYKYTKRRPRFWLTHGEIRHGQRHFHAPCLFRMENRK
jgi:hypothetical protein